MEGSPAATSKQDRSARVSTQDRFGAAVAYHTVTRESPPRTRNTNKKLPSLENGDYEQQVTISTTQQNQQQLNLLLRRGKGSHPSSPNGTDRTLHNLS